MNQQQRSVFVGNRTSLGLLRTLESAGVRTLAELNDLSGFTIVQLLSGVTADTLATTAFARIADPTVGRCRVA